MYALNFEIWRTLFIDYLLSVFDWIYKKGLEDDFAFYLNSI